jgi:hypothetical protein
MTGDDFPSSNLRRSDCKSGQVGEQYTPSELIPWIRVLDRRKESREWTNVPQMSTRLPPTKDAIPTWQILEGLLLAVSTSTETKSIKLIQCGTTVQRCIRSLPFIFTLVHNVQVSDYLASAEFRSANPSILGGHRDAPFLTTHNELAITDSAWAGPQGDGPKCPRR